MYMDFTLREKVGLASSESRAEAIASLTAKFAPRRVSAFAKGRSVHIQFDPQKVYDADNDHLHSWLKSDIDQYEMTVAGTREYAKSLLQADWDDVKVQKILEEMLLVESEKMNG